MEDMHLFAMLADRAMRHWIDRGMLITCCCCSLPGGHGQLLQATSPCVTLVPHNLGDEWIVCVRLLQGYLEKQGIQSPTPVQCEAIPRILAGENVAVQCYTGSGKVRLIGPVLSTTPEAESGSFRGPLGHPSQASVSTRILHCSWFQMHAGSPLKWVFWHWH